MGTTVAGLSAGRWPTIAFFFLFGRRMWDTSGAYDDPVPHPTGSSGSKFTTNHSFAKAYASVGSKGLSFLSTTGEKIEAKQGRTRDGSTQTIVFSGERNRHGSVCRSVFAGDFGSLAMDHGSVSAPRLSIRVSEKFR